MCVSQNSVTVGALAQRKGTSWSFLGALPWCREGPPAGHVSPYHAGQAGRPHWHGAACGKPSPLVAAGRGSSLTGVAPGGLKVAVGATVVVSSYTDPG